MSSAKWLAPQGMDYSDDLCLLFCILFLWYGILLLYVREHCTVHCIVYRHCTLYNSTLLNIDQIKLFIENRRKQLNIVFCKQNIRKGEHFKTKTKTSKELYWRSELIINKTVILSLNFSIRPFLSFYCRKTFRF